MTHVLIVEDERLAGEMLARYVHSAPDRYSLAKLIPNAADAPLVCSRTKIDLILMDVCTEANASGLDAAKRVKEMFPEIKIIIVTSAPEFRFLEKAKEAGAESFWYKNITEDELLTVMDRTMAGERVYPGATPVVQMGDTDNHHFTDRELETLYWLVKAGTAKEIAREMHCSPRTVESNLQSLYNKTGCASKTELAILAVQWKKETRYIVSTGKTEKGYAFQANSYVQKAALLRIPSGAALNVQGAGGWMSMTAQLPSTSQMKDFDEILSPIVYNDERFVMNRDVFVVDGGTLTVQGGSYQAGRRKDRWLCNAVNLDGGYNVNGYGEQAINGSAVVVQNGGKVFLNGGTFIGHGNTVIDAVKGSVEIRDAIVQGYTGADSLRCDGEQGATILVYSGEFETKAPKHVAWPSWQLTEFWCFNGKPGDVSLECATLKTDTEKTTSGNRTVVTPVARWEGAVAWGDGTTGDKEYCIGSDLAGTSQTVTFTPPATYFPQNTIAGGQKVEYFWNVKIKTDSGNWKNYNNIGWVPGGKTVDLRQLAGTWQAGREYRIQARMVETWTSESHSYETRTTSASGVSFTTAIKNEIAQVTVNGLSGQSVYTASSLTSSTKGVKSVSSSWYWNGTLASLPLNVTSGAYQAYITVTAKDGYTFTKDTKVYVEGIERMVLSVSADGKTLKTWAVRAVECDHSKSTATWQSNTEEHYKTCSVCGKEVARALHSYDSGVSSGSLTTFTCTVCGYEKTIKNGKEAVSAILLDMPALVAGETLTAPVLASDFADKVTITGYQWYKGSGTTTKVPVGTVVEENNWYTIEVTAKVKSGYYFKDTAFVSHSHGIKLGSSATDDALTGTARAFCYAPAKDGKVTIPALTPNKTLGDVLKDVVASRAGDSKIPVNFAVDWDGNQVNIKRAANGTWSTYSSSPTAQEILANKIAPSTEYTIEVEFSAGKYYVDPAYITVESESYLVGYTTDRNDTWAYATATVVSESDELDRIDIDGVVMPEAGAQPDYACSISDERLTLVSAGWGTKSPYTCGKDYTFTVVVEPVAGYRFADSVEATVCGINAKVTVSGGQATVTYNSGELEHSFSPWTTVTMPSCQNEGTLERTCGLCGAVESDVLPIGDHDLVKQAATASTCHQQGMAEHSQCSVCGKLFDADGNECTAAQLALPLDKNNHEGGELVCDETTHYTLCACGEKLDLGKHVFQNGECYVCGYLAPDTACDGGDSCPSHIFTDVDPAAWYHEAVDYAVEHSLVSGDGLGHFNPDGILTRAMLCQLLYNNEGLPPVGSSSPFSDVPAGQWYTNAVIWAYEKHIVSGDGTGKFNPTDVLTHEQLVTFFWIYGGTKTSSASLDGYSDAGKIGSYAVNAYKWAHENGIIPHVVDGVLDPKGSATRAELAQILMNYLES